MGKRKNSTKAERTALLKKLGYTEADMQKFWDECIPVNSKIKMLSDAGMNWTDLCVWQIEKLPTLKETTLQQLAEKEEAQRKEEQEKQRKIEAEKYYQEHFDEIMVQKIESHEDLTEKEIRTLVFECNEVERCEGENRRWSRTVSSIIELCGRFFKVIWEQGLTENQDDSFYEQPYEVELDSYKKVIEVHNWIKKGSTKPKRINELKYEVSDDDIYSIIDSVTEFMYCNFGDCHMEKITWDELQNVRDCIKENAMDMIKSNLGL